MSFVLLFHLHVDLLGGSRSSLFVGFKLFLIDVCSFLTCFYMFLLVVFVVYLFIVVLNDFSQQVFCLFSVGPLIGFLKRLNVTSARDRRQRACRSRKKRSAWRRKYQGTKKEAPRELPTCLVCLFNNPTSGVKQSWKIKRTDETIDYPEVFFLTFWMRNCSFLT